MDNPSTNDLISIPIAPYQLGQDTISQLPVKEAAAYAETGQYAKAMSIA